MSQVPPNGNKTWIAIALALVLLPALGMRLQPNQYEGGRSRDVDERAKRNTSAIAIMIGELRTSLSDVMFIKTERYLDSGVAYEPHMADEILSVSGATEEFEHMEAEARGEGEAHDHGVTETIIPTAAKDFRGLIGRLHREVKPWRPPSAPHNHTTGLELIPWYKVMTVTDPNYVNGYTLGAWWLKQVDSDQGLAFIREGLEKNPDSFQIHYMHGQLLFDKAKVQIDEHNGEVPPPAAKLLEEAFTAYQTAVSHALKQRPENPEEDPNWTDYMEADAIASARMAVLITRDYVNLQTAATLAKNYLDTFKIDDIVFFRTLEMAAEAKKQ